MIFLWTYRIFPMVRPEAEVTEFLEKEHYVSEAGFVCIFRVGRNPLSRGG
jgi:hypothetical protein